MRVICPHVGPIAEETSAALDASGWKWERIDVGGEDTAYTRLLATLWSAGRTFAIVEHDIVIRPGALEELDRCPLPWCAFTYQFRNGLISGLGCTKFSADLIRAHPHAVAHTWAEQTLVHPAGHWCNLDDRLRRVLTAKGVYPHLHAPPVEHLSPMPSHGCT